MRRTIGVLMVLFSCETHSQQISILDEHNNAVRATLPIWQGSSQQPTIEEVEEARTTIGRPQKTEEAERTSIESRLQSGNGLNHRRRQWVEFLRSPNGETNGIEHELVEMNPGLNFLNERGELEESYPEFVEKDGNAVATRLQFKVRIAGSLNVEGGIQVTQPNGVVLRSQVVGLRYVDSVSGKGVILSGIKDSRATIVGTNQVLYPDAFSEVKASIRYTVSINGLEQDILLHEQPPTPEEFGLDSTTTELQVLTEFLGNPQRRFVNPPRDREAAGRANGSRGTSENSRNNSTDSTRYADVDIDFGEMRIGHGRAFSANGEDVLSVRKEWQRLENREFLVENLSVRAAAPALQRLRQREGARSNPRQLQKTSKPRVLVQASTQLIPPGRQSNPVDAVPLARPTVELLALLARPMMILDYNQTLIGGAFQNWTFEANQTYWIRGVNIMQGHTVFEGGTVLKYARFKWNDPINYPNNNWVEVQGTSEFQTTAFKPAIFTAVDDQTVGETIPGSGSIAYLSDSSIRYGPHALVFANGSGTANIKHVKVYHTWYGITCWNSKTDNILSHGQFKATNPIYVAYNSTTLYVRNCLIESGYFGFEAMDTGKVFAEHLTVWNPYRILLNQVAQNNSTPAPASNVSLRNCLIVSIQDPSFQAAWTDLGGNRIVTTGWSEFQSVGGGKFYLREGSPFRNAGTTQISPDLKADFSDFTTTPPSILTGSIANGTELGPVVQRDNALPDIGYHYPALDYYVQNLSVANAIIGLTNGVAIGFSHRSAFDLGNGAVLKSIGRPDRLNRILRQSLIQEDTVSGQTTFDSVFSVAAGLASAPSLYIRFTEVSAVHWTDNRRILISSGYISRLAAIEIRDSSFTGIVWSYEPGSSGASAQVKLINNSFERCSLSMLKRTPYSHNTGFEVEMRNNHFWRTPLVLTYEIGTSNPSWTHTDNVFHGVPPSLTQAQGSTVNRSNNAFIACSNSGFGGTGDQILSSLLYQEGPYGRWYQRDTTLRNLGSRNSDIAGLFHYTTDPEQVKEYASIIDIGFHYVATESHRASAEFSGTQGQANWYYRMSSTLLGPANSNIPGYTPGTWLDNTLPNGTSNPDYYTMIGAAWIIPGQTRDTVREYAIPADGRIWATGWVADNQNCGVQWWTDGAKVRIAIDGQTRLDWIDIPEWSGTGSYSWKVACTSIAVLQGQRLQFQINRGPSSNGCDTTLWDPVICWSRPSDSDGDGIGDWFEDSNGNGQFNASSGECANWQALDSDSDGISDLQEILAGTNPLSTLSPTGLVPIY